MLLLAVLAVDDVDPGPPAWQGASVLVCWLLPGAGLVCPIVQLLGGHLPQVARTVDPAVTAPVATAAQVGSSRWEGTVFG